jgi:HlyD family secretion protein
LWLIVVLLVAGGAGFVLWKPTGSNASAQAYRLATVDRGPITASVRATGTLNPVTTVLVGSQLSGQVVEILADYNTPVKEGQVVARLYAEQIKSRRDAALADLAQARALRASARRSAGHRLSGATRAHAGSAGGSPARS